MKNVFYNPTKYMLNLFNTQKTYFVSSIKRIEAKMEMYQKVPTKALLPFTIYNMHINGFDHLKNNYFWNTSTSAGAVSVADWQNMEVY